MKTDHELKTALVRKARFDARHITVAITGIESELTETLSSLAEALDATTVAWSAPGVTRVDNLLTVAHGSLAGGPLGESPQSCRSGRV